MKKLAFALAASAACALSLSSAPATAASMETVEAKMTASSAAAIAREDMYEAFGDKELKPGGYLWRKVPASAGPERVVISLGDQLAYLYRGGTLMAVATISTGEPGRDTPTGIFTVLGKKPMHRSKKYDNAPMPHSVFFTGGYAIHATDAVKRLGSPASHGCVRLAPEHASDFYRLVQVFGQQNTQIVIQR